MMFAFLMPAEIACLIMGQNLVADSWDLMLKWTSKWSKVSINVMEQAVLKPGTENCIQFRYRQAGVTDLAGFLSFHGPG